MFPEPSPGQVRVKIEACGICHSDALVKEGLWPGCNIRACQATRLRTYRRHCERTSPHGRQVSVSAWVGTVDIVLSANSVAEVTSPCASIRKVTGIDFDGGYAEYMIAPATALAAIPDELARRGSRSFHVRRRNRI